MALRVGAEDKKKTYLAAGLGALMLLLLVRFLWQNFGSSSPPPPPPAAEMAAPAQQPPALSQPVPFEASSPGAERVYGPEAAKVMGSPLDPTLHPEVMKQAESLEYTGKGRNIFSQFSTPADIPSPIASVRQIAAQHSGPPPPAPPPAIDLRFYGYAAARDGIKRIFLLHGDDIFIASEGDIVDRRYRVAKIGATSIQVEDLPYHDTQTLPLQQ